MRPLFSALASLSIILNSLTGPALVWAQEDLPQPTSEPISAMEPSVSSEPSNPTPTPEPSAAPELTSTPLPSVLPETTPEASISSVEPTPELLPQPEASPPLVETPTESEPTPQPGPSPTLLWIPNSDASFTTQTLQLGATYKFPLNEKVSLTFTKLPEGSGTITVKEIKLTTEQVGETGALSDTAYDISSTMEDGSFEYTLTLPTPKTDNVEVKVSEDGQSFVTLGGVTAQTDTLTITGLNHFTIFVVASPAGNTSDPSIGEISWTLGDTLNSNGLYATVTLGNNGISHYLWTNNYGLSIPAGATILGIKVEVERKCSDNVNCHDKSVKLIKGGVVGGNDKADTLTDYPTIDTYQSYGGDSDLWGQSWTSADLNSPNFGVAFATQNVSGNSKTISVDHIKVTIAYDSPPSFDAISNPTLNEDAPEQNVPITNVSPGPESESGQTVTLSATSNNTSLVPNPAVSGAGATRTLTYTPVANASGTATITVTATDSQNSTFSRTFTITVVANGHIVIVKDAITNNSQDFTFQDNFGNGNPPTFQLDDDSGATGANNTLSNTDSFEVLPGTYSVTEDEVPGWKLADTSCSNGGFADNISVSAGETVTCTFTNKKLATITLVKNTVGGDGTFDFDMTGMSLPPNTQLTTSGNTASQTFNDIDPDDSYTISENIPEGWDLTSSSCTGTNTPDNITPNNGELITCTFTNTQLGSISGYKFIDLNGDGLWDEENEWAENDWLITLSGGPNDTYEEAYTGEMDEGQYLFENLLPGTYQVCEDIAYSTDNVDGWAQTTPRDNPLCPDGTNGYGINLSAGENIIERNFGNFRKITISGWKFEDMLADGSYNPDDPNHPDRRLSGWTIFIDEDGDGVLDEGERTTTTNEDGDYSFDNVGPGTYKIREVTQSGWIQTTTNPDGIVAQSGNDISGINFGNFKKVIIDIFKWKDLDANGVPDAGEPPIGGLGMRIEEAIKTLSSTPNPVEGQPPVMTEEIIYGGLRILPTNDDGHALPEVDKPGTYRVTEESQDNFQRTHPLVDSFFDIFVEFSGQTSGEGETSITKDKNGQPLKFGNAPFQQVGGSGTKFVPTSGDSSLTISLVVIDPAPICPGGACVMVEGQPVGSNVVLQNGTVITRSDGEMIDLSQLGAQAPSLGDLTGLGNNVVVDGALQWGIPNFGLEFDKPITLNIFVGTSLNGQTLNVVRSTTGTSGWTSDGIEPPATCLVTSGICTFQATKASYYATTHTSSTTSSTSGGGGGGSLSAASAPSCGDPKPGGAPTLISAAAGANSATLTWSKAAGPVTYYLVNYSETPGVFQYGNPNVGGPDTTSYTVFGLSGGTTYYFKVRAGNNCAPGDYSNEVSVTPAGGFISGPAAGFIPGVLGGKTEKQEVESLETESIPTSEEAKPPIAATAENVGILAFLGNLIMAVVGFFTKLSGK